MWTNGKKLHNSFPLEKKSQLVEFDMIWTFNPRHARRVIRIDVHYAADVDQSQLTRARDLQARVRELLHRHLSKLVLKVKKPSPRFIMFFIIAGTVLSWFSAITNSYCFEFLFQFLVPNANVILRQVFMELHIELGWPVGGLWDTFGCVVWKSLNRTTSILL